MRNVARIVPGTAALFLAIMAIMINSPALFYMATAMIATIAASRIQAALSVRGLRLERIAPPAVNVGELVTVAISVWSDRKIKRPLVTITDGLPKRIAAAALTPSLPVAPSYDQPIQTRYSFRPMRRGRYKWNTVTVTGTDALGLVSTSRTYTIEPAELTVYPAPIAVNIPVPLTAGVGISDAETGKFRGSGIEPRGVREYQPGEPERYVHWASSARSSTLMVKEFEVGSGQCAIFVFQRQVGSEFGTPPQTTLEAACGHVKYLCNQYLRQGATVLFPILEDTRRGLIGLEQRRQEIDDLLAGIVSEERATLAEDLMRATQLVPSGGTLFVIISLIDPELPAALAQYKGYQRVCLVYDQADYVPRNRVQQNENPASTAYLQQLRAAGADVIVMPKVGEI